MAKHHYVYNSFEEWGRGYIGIRSCDCLPEEDAKYFGSFRDKSFNPTKKDILFVRETRQEVAEIEIKLHDFFDVAVNPQFANMAKAVSTGFDRAGVPDTEQTKSKKSKATSGKNNPMFGRIGENNPNYGVPHTEERKRKNREANTGEKHSQYGRTGALHHSSKAIIAIKPDGTELHFGSGREAARVLEIPSGSLCTKHLKTGNVLKRGKFKGWQFFYENL